MTVGVAHTVLRYKPTFGNLQQIAARNLLRLAVFYLEISHKRMFDIRSLTQAELERELQVLGHDPHAILAEWNAVAAAVGMQP